MIASGCHGSTCLETALVIAVGLKGTEHQSVSLVSYNPPIAHYKCKMAENTLVRRRTAAVICPMRDWFSPPCTANWAPCSRRLAGTVAVSQALDAYDTTSVALAPHAQQNVQADISTGLDRTMCASCWTAGISADSIRSNGSDPSAPTH